MRYDTNSIVSLKKVLAERSQTGDVCLIDSNVLGPPLHDLEPRQFYGIGLNLPQILSSGHYPHLVTPYVTYLARRDLEETVPMIREAKRVVTTRGVLDEVTDCMSNIYLTHRAVQSGNTNIPIPNEAYRKSLLAELSEYGLMFVDVREALEKKILPSSRTIDDLATFLFELRWMGMTEWDERKLNAVMEQHGRRIKKSAHTRDHRTDELLFATGLSIAVHDDQYALVLTRDGDMKRMLDKARTVLVRYSPRAYRIARDAPFGVGYSNNGSGCQVFSFANARDVHIPKNDVNSKRELIRRVRGCLSGSGPKILH